MVEEGLSERKDSNEKSAEYDKAVKEKKSRLNVILAVVLSSSVLTAAATEGIEIVRGEFQEDVARCELALDAIQNIERQDLDLFSEGQVDIIKREVVGMLDANCYKDPSEKEAQNGPD